MRGRRLPRIPSSSRTSACTPSALCAPSSRIAGFPAISSRRPGGTAAASAPRRALAIELARREPQLRQAQRERGVVAQVGAAAAAAPPPRPRRCARRSRRRRRRARAPARRARRRRRPTQSAAPRSSTASFSARISSRVSPSTRWWSRPTFVSPTTRALTTRVASWRPPRPASTTQASTPASASTKNAAAVSASNCVGPSPCSRSTARAASCTRSSATAKRRRADRAAVDLHALVPADHVRREVGAGAQARRGQRGGGEAHRRRLAVRADDVDRVEPLLRIARARSSSAVMRSSPSFIPNGASDSR